MRHFGGEAEVYTDVGDDFGPLDDLAHVPGFDFRVFGGIADHHHPLDLKKVYTLAGWMSTHPSFRPKMRFSCIVAAPTQGYERFKSRKIADHEKPGDSGGSRKV
jgi:hypothetical protein